MNDKKAEVSKKIHFMLILEVLYALNVREKGCINMI